MGGAGRGRRGGVNGATRCVLETGRRTNGIGVDHIVVSELAGQVQAITPTAKTGLRQEVSDDCVLHRREACGPEGGMDKTQGPNLD